MANDEFENTVNISQIEGDVNESRDKFLEAVEASRLSQGRVLVVGFLQDLTQSHEQRSPISQEHAIETIQRIQSIDGCVFSITGRVAQANIALQLAIANLTILTFDQMTRGLEDGSGELDIDRLKVDLTNEARLAAGMLIEVHREATKILNNSGKILAKYISEAIGVDWSDKLKKIFEELEKIGDEEASTKAWTAINEVVSQLVKDYADLPGELFEEAVEDVYRLIRILRALVGKKNIPEYGKTDVMLRLLHELRTQEVRMHELAESHNLAIQKLRKIGKGNQD